MRLLLLIFIPLVPIIFQESAQARENSIFLNDLRLLGGELRGQTLTGVDVRFDENGDIHIIAKGYKVAVSSPSPSAAAKTPATPAASPAATPAQAALDPTGPRLSGKRYYLVPSPQRHPGAAQYDVEVLVNGTFVTKFRSKDPEPYVEITRFMQDKFRNTIRLIARKEAGPRISESAEDVFELILGTGEPQSGRLELAPLQRYRRSAAENTDYATEMTLDLSR